MTTADPPRVSIVVPAYNRGHLIGRTLDSVLAQTMPDWELVVSDDGSVDDTRAVAEEYARRDHRIRVTSDVNGGVARARNRGFAVTDERAPYVIFLDSDDRWLPDALEALVHELEARPDLVSAHGLARCIDDDDQLIPGDDIEERLRDRREYRGRRLVPVGPADDTTFPTLLHYNYTCTPGLHMVRRRVLDAVGAFDPLTDPADDWDIAIRISRQGPIGFLDRVVLEWRKHPDTLTDTSPRWHRAYYRVRAKTVTSPENSVEQHRLARIAFLSPGRANLVQAWSDLRRRDLRTAARDVVRSGDVGVQYLGAIVPFRCRTLWARRPGGAHR